jgi:hypothetical protein
LNKPARSLAASAITSEWIPKVTMPVTAKMKRAIQITGN